MSINTMYTAVSGVQANQSYISVVANNLANINTLGFKGSRATFADQFSQQLQSSGPVDSQIGLGVMAPTVAMQFSEGSLQSTGQPTDLALTGEGFFVVNNPLTNEHLFTRAGAFTVDSSGFLSTPAGQRLMGGGPTAAPGDPLVELQIPQSVGGVPVIGYAIDTTGQINATLQDGTNSVLGKVSVENFKNPQGLENVGGNLFRPTATSGQEFINYNPAASNGVGEIQSGYLEQSNVDLSQSFADMILAQRGLQANARVITTTDEILQELINLKH